MAYSHNLIDRFSGHRGPGAKALSFPSKGGGFCVDGAHEHLEVAESLFRDGPPRVPKTAVRNGFKNLGERTGSSVMAIGCGHVIAK